MDTKIKIALVRGRNLNKWEMQNYENIIENYDITGFTSIMSRFDTSEINFPIKKLFCFDELLDYIPGYKKLIKFLPIYNRIKKLLIKYTCSDYLVRLEKNLKGFDIVHTAELYNAYTLQAINAKRKGYISKVVVTVWENIPYYDDLLNYDLNVDYILDNIDKFLAVSLRSASVLKIAGVKPEKIEVIKPGINLKKFKPLTKKDEFINKLNINIKSFNILTIARYDWGKGIQDLICSIALIINRKPSLKKIIKVNLIGHGKLQIFLEKLVTKYSLQDIVQFNNYIPYKETIKWYQASDLFILPSTLEHGWQEQFGMVLVEAQACGLPVISTMTGSISEVLPNSCPKFPPSDFYSLAELIDELVFNPAKLKKIGELCYQNALTQYDSEKFGKKINKIYQNL